MDGAVYRRLALGLAVVVLLLGAICGYLCWNQFWLEVEVAFAAEQTEIFDDMRLKSLSTSHPAEIARYLQYAVNYYPLGTKQQPGSLLDQVVERHRANAVREIIAELRAKTGQDFGDDPQRWIDEYVPR